MYDIKVSQLKKNFQVNKKQPGLIDSFKTFFNPRTQTFHALKGISFQIRRGELVGFIGPNGAGKTTTLKCLSGLLHPTSGKIEILGFTPFHKKYQFLKKISLVMGQKNQLWWDLPAIDTFQLNREIYEMDEFTFKKNLSELTEILEVGDILNTPVRKLSLGQRMKMELIAAIMHGPQVLFLDEPTIGLDVVMQKNMRDFIKKYNGKSAATIILTSHDMADVKSLCQRIIIIDKGKIVYDGNFDNIINKFSKHKLISFVLDKKIELRTLAKFGHIKYYVHPKVVLEVEKEKSVKYALKILENLDVSNFNIEDPDIEDIVRDIFSGNLPKKEQ
jgi:ABC-2 type transport system ATP-binding protein